MTAPADLVVTQLSVETGEAQESADFVTVSRPAGLWPLRRRTDQFCALLAPDRLGQAALCRQILDVMEREFAASGSRSATSALAAVLQAAHQFLRHENANALPEDRVHVYVAAAVLRSGSAYLGRIGRTFAAVRHHDELQRYMGGPETGGDGNPLGGEADPDISYAMCTFMPDDLLVLASGPQWERLREDYVAAAMEEGEPSAVASALYELAVWRQTRPSFSILVVEARTPERRGWLPRFGGSAAAVEEVEEDVVAPVRGGGRRAAGWGGSRHADDALDDEDDYAPPARGRTGTAVAPTGRGRRRHGYDDDHPAHPTTPMERVRATVDQVLGATLATLPPRVLLIALMALALVVLVVLGFALVQILRPAPDQAAALTAMAQTTYDQARRAPDSPQAREQLEDARRLLTQALALRDDPARRTLLTEVQAELDRVDRVNRLPNTPALIEFSGLPSNAALTRVVINGTDIFVLDVGGAQLLRYQLQADGSLVSSQPTTLVKRGDRVQGAEVGGLITMGWVGPGGPRTDSTLVVVESGRTFITFGSTGQPGRIIPAENRSWSAIAAMSSYQGNIYLADPDRQIVMEYRPTRNTYDSPPVPPVLDAQAVLQWPRVVDLAADSNSLYVLQLDGAVRRYSRRDNGAAQAFGGQAPGGLRSTLTMNEPAGDAQPLYVADAGNERVVQFAPDGTYQRQFRAPAENTTALQDLRDVFVVPQNHQLYVLTSRGLYRYDLPAD